MFSFVWSAAICIAMIAKLSHWEFNCFDSKFSVWKALFDDIFSNLFLFNTERTAAKKEFEITCRKWRFHILCCPCESVQWSEWNRMGTVTERYVRSPFDIVASLFGLLPSANHKIYDLLIFSPTTQKIIPSWLFPQFLFISQNQFILTSQTVLIFNFYTKISLLTSPQSPPIGMPFRWNLLSGSSVECQKLIKRLIWFMMGWGQAGASRFLCNVQTSLCDWCSEEILIFI